MNALIPVLIHDQFVRDRTSGSLSGICLTVDVSGFTAVAEDLMDHGKDGAEELSRLINDLFGNMVRLTHAYRGQILSFAGDALTALFAPQDTLSACTAAVGMRDLVRGRRRLETRFGLYRISVRIGLAMGGLRWGIVGHGSRRSYYFAGEAIDRSIEAQGSSRNAEIVVAAGLAQLLGNRGVKLQELARNLSILEKLGDFGAAAPIQLSQPKLDSAAVERFFPEEVVNWRGSGEFRQVTAVFVGIRNDPAHPELDRIASGVLESCELHGGYLNLLDYGDKGFLMFGLFGAPTAHEDDTERAVDFALALSKEFGNSVRFGCAAGVAYTGLIGADLRCTYTAMGSTVNLAARLMQQAPWGTVYCQGELSPRLSRGYAFTSVGSVELKGFDRPVGALRIAGPGLGEVDRFLTRFVGRDGEVARVANRVRAAAEGRPGGVTYLYGEAGMGKSRLAHEAVKKMAATTRVFVLEADPILRKSLTPFSSFLGSYFELSEDAEARAARFNDGYDDVLNRVRSKRGTVEVGGTIKALERYRPFIGALLGVHGGSDSYESLDPQARFENTVYGVTEFMRAQCLLAPVVFIVEGAEALDADSLELFAYLLRNLAQSRAAIVVTSRYGDDGSRPVLHPADYLDVEEVALGPLSLRAVEEILAERIGGPVGERTLRLIFEKTQGNPLFVEQFAVFLIEAGSIELSDGCYALTNDLSEVPTSINGLLIARLDRLQPRLKNVTQVASVFGQQFREDILSSLMESPSTGGRMQRASVRECIEQGRMQRLWTEVGDDIYGFLSALLRDAAYDMQSTDRVRWLHRVAAYALEARFIDDDSHLADLAYHFRLGGVPGKAATYLRKAAEYSAGSFKNEEAIELLQALLDYVDPHEQIDVHLRMAEVNDLQGNWTQAIERLRIGLDLAQRIVRPKEEARILVKAGEIYQKQGRYLRAEDTLKAAVDRARAIGDQQCYGEALLYLGRTYWSTGKYESGIRLLSLAAQTLETVADRQSVALALYYTGVIYRDKGDYRTAMDYYRRSETLFTAVGNRRLETYPLYDLAVLFLYGGELRQAFGSFAEVERVYREIGYKSGLAAALGNLGTISAYQGRFADAEQYETEASGIVHSIGERLAIAYGLFNRGLIPYLRNTHDAAWRIFAEALREMRSIGAQGYYGYVQSYAACSLAHLERYEDSLTLSRDHLKRIIETGSDVENGRTHLAIALVYSLSSGTLDRRAAAVATEIAELTKMEPSAEVFFEESIRRAETASYIATMMSAYVEYATHLLKTRETQSVERAAQFLDRAQALANRTTMSYSTERISTLQKRLVHQK